MSKIVGETEFAVPYAVLRVAIETLSSLPFNQVRELVPRLEACMTEENVVNKNPS